MIHAAHARESRADTARAALIAEVLSLLAATSRPAAPPGEPPSLREPLSPAKTRVPRYLPTNLTAPEIAGQLYVSANTVQTHMRHLYQKLGAHRRSEAVEQARARPARTFRTKALASSPVAADVVTGH